MFGITVLILSLLIGSASAMAQAQQPPKVHKARVKPSPSQPQPATATSQQAVPAPQQPPPPPVTPEHGPSSPPEVSFQKGQLTILARNSTMADVMNAVRQKTGAQVEMPPASGDRVVGQFGPGAPRDVMAQLLNGSHYDYVLLGSPADPGALKSIVLMTKSNGPGPGPSQAHANQPPQIYQNLQQVPEVESENPDENAADTTMPEQAPGDQPADQQPDQGDQQPGAPVVKTPEQLLRELQQQQQQQQEQQQNQSGPPGAPGQPPQQQ